MKPEGFPLMIVWEKKEIIVECYPTKISTPPGIAYSIQIDMFRRREGLIFKENETTGVITYYGSSSDYSDTSESIKFYQVVLKALTAYRNSDSFPYAEVLKMATSRVNLRLWREPHLEREQRAQEAASDLFPKLKIILQDNIWFDKQKECYTIRQQVPESKPLHFDFYPKANKVLIRHQNRWISNGAVWLLNTFDEETKQKREANAWRNSNNKLPE